MIGGLILYLLISKIYLVFRLKFSSPAKIEELKKCHDPYWTLLLTSADGKFDFLEHNNFVMETLSLMCANNMTTILATTMIYANIFDNYANAFITQFVLNFIMLVILLVFVWKGTDYYMFYRKQNLIVIGSLMLI
jgi:hypothetical protein